MKPWAIIICLLPGFFAHQALAINKCTDSNGKTSYQEKACPDSSKALTIEPQTSSKAQPVTAEVKVVDVAVNGSKTFSVGFPGHWQSSTRSSGDSAPTLRIVATDGAPLRLLMTFFPKRQSLGLDDAVLNDAVLDRAMLAIHDLHAKSGNEKKIRSKKVEQVFSDGVGHVLTYVDEALLNRNNPGGDEFAYLTTGAVVIDGMLITISILSNALDSANYAKAMIAIHTIVNSTTG